MEILIPTSGIRNLIREDKIHQIYSAMQTGQEKVGMQTMNQSLASLVLGHRVTLESAMAVSSHKEELQDMIHRGVGVVPGPAPRQAARPPLADSARR
jgi:twitching motility protein PilT